MIFFSLVLKCIGIVSQVATSPALLQVARVTPSCSSWLLVSAVIETVLKQTKSLPLGSYLMLSSHRKQRRYSLTLSKASPPLLKMNIHVDTKSFFLVFSLCLQEVIHTNVLLMCCLTLNWSFHFYVFLVTGRYWCKKPPRKQDFGKSFVICFTFVLFKTEFPP